MNENRDYPESIASTSAYLPLNSCDIFNFKNCIFCKKTWKRGGKRAGRIIKSKSTRDRLLQLCKINDDNWRMEIRQLLENVPCLITAKARYHLDCYVKFTTNKLHSDYSTTTRHLNSLQKVFDHISSSPYSIFKVSELRNMMTTAPDNRTFFRLLKEKYPEEILIIQVQGKSTIIGFRRKIIDKLSDLHEAERQEKKISPSNNAIEIKKTAKLILQDLKAACFETSTYKSPVFFLDDVDNEIPYSLRLFLKNLIRPENQTHEPDEFYELKRTFIAHAILSAIRPKSFQSSLQLALSTYVYRKTACKALINILNRLGICSSYYNTLLFEASVVMNSSINIKDEATVQFVFDNADHNTQTLDGSNTFHCMGGICCVTPKDFVTPLGRIRKLNTMPTAQEIASRSSVPIVPYFAINKSGLEKIIYRDVSSLKIQDSCRFPTEYGFYIWAKALSVEGIPSWRGYMETITLSSPYTVSRVIFLPFIYHPPSDLTTINSSLYLAIAECEKIGKKTCFVTFDQPLYIKARAIASKIGDSLLQEKSIRLVIRLGGFHMVISYMGAIGYIMAGSGLEELWSTIYAAGSIKKMINGHAYARAMRAHILTYTALGTIIVEKIDGIDKELLRQQFTTLVKNSAECFDLKTCRTNTDIKSLTDKFLNKLDSLRDNGPTAALWLQYFECVTILLQFTQADRLGDWRLHLQSVKKMLPIFPSAGHFAYAKSAQIYLQDMIDLADYMDHNEYTAFTEEGFFTACRSDKNFSGISTDQLIEQTLMGALKDKAGGPTHFGGVNATNLARFTIGKIAAVDVMAALEDYCQLQFSKNEQHVENRGTRKKIDNDDLQKLIRWFIEFDPFTSRSSLVSLTTGAVGEPPKIDCHTALTKGLATMDKMVGQNACDISIPRTAKVNSLSLTSSAVKISDDHSVVVDSDLLFQRISVYLNTSKTLHEALEYELAPWPLSLFSSDGSMRKSSKSALYSIFKPVKYSGELTVHGHYVIDGGFLLHTVVWSKGQSYDEISGAYIKYLKKNFGEHVCVVFDGYDACMDTKSYERNRRALKKNSPKVLFKGNMIPTVSQAAFLSNNANKARFVNHLKINLETAGITCYQAEEDADRLIVTTAIGINNPDGPIIVVGNDIDLLLLIIALTPLSKLIMFLKMVPNAPCSLYVSSDYKHMRDYVLFAHAMSGCDTTCSFFDKGKTILFKMMKNNVALQAAAQVFNTSGSTPKELFESAKNIVISLYMGKSKSKKKGELPPSSLGALRYKCYMQALITGKRSPRLEKLPPTESGLYNHALRVYQQVQDWYGNYLTPILWGWKSTSTILIPVTMTKAPAPDKLLKLIHCSCASSNCVQKCTCRTAALKCSELCKNCDGMCSNSPRTEAVSESDIEIDETKETEEND